MSCNLFAASKKRGIEPAVNDAIDTLQTAVKPVSHVVRKGQTLSQIADLYGTDYQSIAQANNISNPNNIYVGQRLNIPDAKQMPIPSKKLKPKPTPKKTIPDETKIDSKGVGCGCIRKSKPWSISQKGVDFLKNYETLKLNMYNDSANHATIGYGHLIHRGPISGKKSEKPFKNGLTEKEATALLKKDLSRYENAVNKYAKVPLCQQEYDALVIFCFNIGIGAFIKSSALRVLNQKKYFLVGNKMKLYNRAGGKVSKGLVNRRAEEVEIFKKGDYVRTR